MHSWKFADAGGRTSGGWRNFGASWRNFGVDWRNFGADQRNFSAQRRGFPATRRNFSATWRICSSARRNYPAAWLTYPATWRNYHDHPTPHRALRDGKHRRDIPWPCTADVHDHVARAQLVDVAHEQEKMARRGRPRASPHGAPASVPRSLTSCSPSTCVSHSYFSYLCVGSGPATRRPHSDSTSTRRRLAEMLRLCERRHTPPNAAATKSEAGAWRRLAQLPRR